MCSMYSTCLFILCLFNVYTVLYTVQACHKPFRCEGRQQQRNLWSFQELDQYDEGSVCIKIVICTALLAVATCVTGSLILIDASKSKRPWQSRTKRSSAGGPVRSMALVTLTVCFGLVVSQLLSLDGSSVLLLSVVMSFISVSLLGLDGAQVFKRLLRRFAISLFIASIPWEFMRLYQTHLAAQAARIMQGAPAECHLLSPTFFSTLYVWWKETFSWNQHGACLEYHKAVLVNPLMEVTPLVVLMSLITRVITKPLEVMAHSIGLSYAAFFSSIPAHWQPLVMVQVTLFITLMLVMSCGYRLNIPCVGRFESTTQTISNIRENIEPKRQIKSLAER